MVLHCVYRCFDWNVIKCSGLIPTPLAVPPSQPDVSGIATHFNNLCRVCCAESFSPQPCPFLDAYTFSYNNNTGGPCRQPVSTATPCSSQSQYRLHFQHCPAYAHTYDRGTPAQQLVCRQRYLVLKLNSALYSRLHLSNLRYTL